MELSEEHLAELRESFRMFDTDRDGAISLAELGTVLKALGQSPTEEELQLMMNSVDTDQNGVIEFDEFVQLMQSYLHSSNGAAMVDAEGEMLEAFRVFDKDGNGLISEDELKQAMIGLGERLTAEELKAMIAAADVNGDGQIDYKEFLEMMRTK